MSGAAPDWAAQLQLEPHPEGGYFRRIYTAERQVDTPGGPRPLATSIWYLLDLKQPRGRLHRNRSDIMHFLLDGGPLEYLLLAAEGRLRRERLGLEASGQRFLLVPGGCWKASQLVPGAAYALVAEVVTPGFDYADHQFATAQDIVREYPQHLELLTPFLNAS